ncbi:MAG TPA: hypothetical protein GX707_16315 [Epulopiscium sp.]|nr:hypothetical protein [Candidatus Epulonipiscium sp.]
MDGLRSQEPCLALNYTELLEWFRVRLFWHKTTLYTLLKAVSGWIRDMEVDKEPQGI